MTTALDVSHRRAEVRRLAQGGASNRAIAAQLNIGKDTVARDLRATEAPQDAPPAPPAPQDAPPETLAQRLAHRRTQTETAMSHLSAAAQAVADAKPAYTPADDATAARWYADLRATLAQLTECADAFAEYYPDTVAHATTSATDRAGAP